MSEGTEGEMIKESTERENQVSWCTQLKCEVGLNVYGRRASSVTTMIFESSILGKQREQMISLYHLRSKSTLSPRRRVRQLSCLGLLSRYIICEVRHQEEESDNCRV